MGRKRLMPLRWAAKDLGVPAGWLREEADAGRLPHVKAGDRYLFDRELVESILLKRARSPVPAAADPERERSDDRGEP